MSEPPFDKRPGKDTGLAAGPEHEAAQNGVADRSGYDRLNNNPHDALRQEVDSGSLLSADENGYDADDSFHSAITSLVRQRRSRSPGSDAADAATNATDDRRTDAEADTNADGVNPTTTRDGGGDDQQMADAAPDGKADTTAAPKQNSEAYEQWVAGGKLPCGSCGRRHPPPCDPEKARKALGMDALQDLMPEEYKKLKNKRRREAKLRKRIDRQSHDTTAGASSWSSQSFSPHDGQTSATIADDSAPGDALQGGMPMTSLDVMAYLVQNVRTQEGLDFVVEMANRDLGQVPPLLLLENAWTTDGIRSRPRNANNPAATDADWSASANATSTSDSRTISEEEAGW